MQKRVLLVDNDVEFLDTRGELLERSGLTVFKAASTEEGEEILQQRWVHLAIIDLRLRDDNDPRDFSGLNLAKASQYRSVPKIILTRYPSIEHVKEALGPRLEGLPPAVDFLDKREGVEAITQAIDRVFRDYLGINGQTQIDVRDGLPLFYLVNLIEPTLKSDSVLDRSCELEDLFRRLFFDSRQVTLSRLVTRQEQRLILFVFVFSQDGAESHYLVSCGPRQVIQQEATNYTRFVPPITTDRPTIRAKQTETIHFGATAYTLTGGNPEEVTPLGSFYRDNSKETIAVLLDNLFSTCLAPWHQRSRFRDMGTRLENYLQEWLALERAALVQEQLGPRIQDLCQKILAAGFAEVSYTPAQLIFHRVNSSSVAYTNPVGRLANMQFSDRPVLCGTIYGQLNADGVLVDRQAHPWLIDYSRLARGPLVYDFVKLESVIKFELLTDPNIPARHEMERRLLSVLRLDQRPDPSGLNLEIQKAVESIGHIRQYAARVIGFETESYWEGLWWYALHQLTQYNPATQYTQRQLLCYFHSLLSVVMLFQNLAKEVDHDLPEEALTSIWIDQENSEVWVESRKIDLAPGEYALLLVLYRQPNRLCTRQEISQQLYSTAYGLETEDAINTTMARLRRKVEPDPSRPRYITTVRGRGYKLELRR